MDRTFVPWSDVIEIVARSMPRLRYLRYAGHPAWCFNATPVTGAPSVDEKAEDATLEELNLSHNHLTRWTELTDAVQHPLFRKVERLNISHNAFERIELAQSSGDRSSGGSGSKLMSLRHVNISSNGGTRPLSWADIEALDDACPEGLESLTVDLASSCARSGSLARPSAADASASASFQPSVSAQELARAASWSSLTIHDARSSMIARLAHLQRLDATPIRKEERRDAEVYVLSKIAEAASSSSLSSAPSAPVPSTSSAAISSQLIKSFPRFEELARKYKDHVPAAASLAGLLDAREVAALQQAQQPQTLKSKLLELSVLLVDEEPDQEAEPPHYLWQGQENIVRRAEIKLLPSMPLKAARMRIARLLSTKEDAIVADQLELYALLSAPGADADEEKVVVDLQADGDAADARTLDYFGLSSRDCIIAYVA